MAKSKIEEVIDKKFVEFYFTKLKKINEKLKKKYNVKEVLLVHFDITIGPLFAGYKKDHANLRKSFKIEKTIYQKDENDLKKLKFCSIILANLSSELQKSPPEIIEHIISELNEKFKIKIIEHDGRFILRQSSEEYYIEVVDFRVNSDATRGNKEMFTLIVFSKKIVKKEKMDKIKEKYMKILSDYFKKLRSEWAYKKFSLKDMKEFYDLVREDKVIQKKKTDPAERIEKLIDSYFGLD